MCFVVELLLNCFWYFQLLCRNKAVKHTSTSMISKDGCFTSSVTLLGVILSVLMRLEFMKEIKAEFQELKAEIRVMEQEVNDRFDKVDQRFDKIDQRFDNLPEELSAFFEPKKQTK